MELWTVKQVAKYLNLSIPKIYPLVRAGNMPGFKIDGSWRFRKDDIDKWLDKCADTGI